MALLPADTLERTEPKLSKLGLIKCKWSCRKQEINELQILHWSFWEENTGTRHYMLQFMNILRSMRT